MDSRLPRVGGIDRVGIEEVGGRKMRYLHELDPDDIRAMQEKKYWESVAELEAEDKAMEAYYERKYSNQ